MSIEVTRELATFFEAETGEALRLVAHYDEDSIEFVYVREDLVDTYTEHEFVEAFEIHRQDRTTAAQQEAIIDAGRHHCTLRVFDGAIIFNFSQQGPLGTVVSLDPEVGRNLLAFVGNCLRELDAHSPQEVTVPRWAL